MSPICWGDREQLYREGVQRFLLALTARLRRVGTWPDETLWRSCYTVAGEVTQAGASLETAADALAEAWQASLQFQWKIAAQCTTLEQQLSAACEEARNYKLRWENLRDTASTAQLHAWQDRAYALERELTQARAAQRRLEARLAELQQELAMREATIAELNRLIARQVTEFEALFGAADPDGAA